MSVGQEIERIEFSRLADLPGVEIMRVEGSRRHWRVYHETYTVCTVPACNAFSAEWVYRRKTHLAEPPVIMFMEPGELHVNKSMPGAATFWVLDITPAVVERAARELGVVSRPPHLKVAQFSDPALFHSIVEFHAGLERPSTTLEQQSRFAAFLRLLLEQCTERGVPALGNWSDRPAVRRARELIHERCAANITLDELSAAAGLSRFHLLRVFKNEVGLPPHAYQLQVRVARARTLLAGGMPAAAVAADLGFADQSHFTRHFRRVVGVTPGVYAKGSGTIRWAGPRDMPARECPEAAPATAITF